MCANTLKNEFASRQIFSDTQQETKIPCLSDSAHLAPRKGYHLDTLNAMSATQTKYQAESSPQPFQPSAVPAPIPPPQPRTERGLTTILYHCDFHSPLNG